MKSLKVFFFDYHPERFLKSVTSYKCHISQTYYEDADFSNFVDDDAVLIVLPKFGHYDYEEFMKSLKKVYQGPLFALDHTFITRNKAVCTVNDVDLYFAMPMSPDEVYKYISYYAYSKNYKEEVLSYKDITVDMSRRQVFRKGREYYLRNKEFELLYYLIRNPGIVLSKQRILEEVWDMNASSCTTTVESHISSLRKKIDKDFEQQYLQTVHCVGYKFE
jgi:DNA-binding response OmpR family regulator